MPKPLNNWNCDQILVSPSILAADFARLGEDVKRVDTAGADLMHMDVMDAHFVPNLTIGPALISSLRSWTDKPFDTHLMISDPLRYLEPFIKAGSDHITFHIEADSDPLETIRAIHSFGCSAGVSLKPGTPAEALNPVIRELDLVLIMTVEPGFGGQSFMADMVPKIAKVRDMLRAVSSRAHIEVDGGIGESNVAQVVEAGANMLVAGTSVFRHREGAEVAVGRLHDAQKLLQNR